MQSIHYTGQTVSAEEMRGFYAAADVLVSSSDVESFGLSILESMYFSLPVLASDSGGPNSLIKNQRTGLLHSVEKEKSGKVLI